MYSHDKKTKLNGAEKAALQDAYDTCLERMNGYSNRDATHGELMSLLNRWGYSTQNVEECISLSERLLWYV